MENKASNKSNNNKGLKVIAAGLYRSGTYSIKTALEHLGYKKCYHMFEFLARPQDEPYWNNAVDKKEVNWDTLFEEYAAAVDIPTVEVIEQVIAKYPDAKVILNIRDPVGWFESCQETMFQVLPGWFKSFPHIVKTSNYILHDRLEGKYLEKDFMIDYYNRHKERVRKLVPKEQLLDNYHVTNGWKPLCDFLGFDVPAIPFPRLNDRKSIKQKLELAKQGIK